MLEWIKARLAEKTTWTGLIGLMTALGVAVNADLSDAIVAAGTAVGALVSAILVAVNTTESK